MSTDPVVTSMSDERTFQLIAEDLAQPLLRSAILAEHALINSDKSIDHLRLIAQESRYGLLLLEGLQLAANYGFGKQQLPLEPVSVGSVLVDVTAELRQLAKLLGVEANWQLTGSTTTVSGHRKALFQAIYSIGHDVLLHLANTETKKDNNQLILAAKRTKLGVHVGIFSPQKKIIGGSLKDFEQLAGIARRPMHNTIQTAGGGIFVARALCTSMNTELRAGHKALHGGFSWFMPHNQQTSLLDMVI